MSIEDLQNIFESSGVGLTPPDPSTLPPKSDISSPQSLEEIFQSSGIGSEAPPSIDPPGEPGTLTRGAGEVSSFVANAASTADKAVTRASDIGKEALFNAGKSIARLPLDAVQAVSDLILPAFGVEPGGPDLASRFDAATGASKLFESDLAKSIIPVLKDKSGVEQFASKAIQFAGESVAFYLTGLGVVGKLSSKKDKLLAAKSIMKEASKTSLGDAFLSAIFSATKSTAKGTVNALTGKAPKGVTGAARSAIAGAAGGEVASRLAPNSPFAELIGNLTAQIGPGIVTAAAKSVVPKKFKETTLASFFPEEANQRILKDLQNTAEGSGGLKQAEQNIKSSQRTTDTINKAAGADDFKTDLAGSTGNPAIISEKKRITSKLKEGNLFSERERKSKQSLNDAVDSITPNADINLSRDVTQKKLNKVEKAFDTRIKTLTKEIEDDTSKLISPLDEQISGIKFRDDIVDVRHKNNQTTNKLYKKIDQKIEADMSDFFKANSKLVERFKGEIGESSSLGLANKDIEETFLKKGNIASMGEIVEMRKALSTELRNVSKGSTPNLTKAKFLDDTIQALDETLSKAMNVAGTTGDPKLLKEISKFKKARSFTRKVKQRFDQGIMKKILSTETQGDFRLTDSQILPAIVQARGINPDFVDKTLNVIKSKPQAKKIFADHVRKTALLPKGQSATTKSIEAFVNLNRTAINKIPGLKAELNSILAKKVRLDTKLADKIRPDSPLNSYRASAELLLGKKADKVMNGILQSSSPKEAMKRAMEVMDNDVGGVNGLKNAFIEDFKKTTGGTIQESAKLKKFLTDNKEGFDTLFKDSPESKKILNAVADGSNIIHRGGVVSGSVTGAAPGIFSKLGNTMTNLLSKSRIILVDKFGPAIFGTIAAQKLLGAGADIGQSTVDSFLAIAIADNKLAKAVTTAAKTGSEKDVLALSSAIATSFGVSIEQQVKASRKK